MSSSQLELGNTQTSSHRDANQLQQHLSNEGLTRVSISSGDLNNDHKYVDWEGPDDPENPRNWIKRKKWLATALLAAYTFISPLGSTFASPAIPNMAENFGITNSSIASMIVSIYILGFAFGPLFFAPMSEIYGRNINLQFANLFLLIFNIACALAKNTTQMLIFRFLAGSGGSAPLAIGGGTINDLWAPNERAKAMAIYSVGPLLGPILGPAIAGYMVESIGYQWIFWITAIFSGICAIFGFIFLRETYSPILLQRKALELSIIQGTKLITINEARNGKKSQWKIILDNLKRPFLMLTTDPICFILSLYMAFTYGTIYLMFTTFPSLFQKGYGFSPGVSGLMYLGPGIGFVISTIAAGFFIDRIYILLKIKNGGIGTPEMRIPGMFIASTLAPIGLIWYGWSADKLIFWIMPLMGSAIFGFSIMMSFLCIQTYLVDTFIFAASAISAATVFRSLCGFAFPLFGPSMFETLGIGWGNTLLAILALIIGVPFPIIIYKLGDRLRKKSHFAKSVED